MNNQQIVNSTELIKHNDTEYSFKSLVDLYLSKFEKINHKVYRNIIKKVKRKYFRQKNGILRDQLIEKFNTSKKNDPSYKKLFEQQELKKQKEIEHENREKEKDHQIWLAREKLAQIEWQAKKDKLNREKEKKQELMNQDVVECINIGEIKTKFQKNENDGNNSSTIHNPIVSLVQAKEADKCFFYEKTGICKYGIRCAKSHDLCESSSILLFINMYSGLQQLYSSLKEDYECDTSLEYEEKDIYNHFKEFYYDVLNEFKTIGPVVQFKVCCNYQIHLRGNVYVQFKSENDALKALQSFNGRFYGGRHIYCSFVSVNSWREAICGLFLHKKCPKARNCSFLHVFKDPDNEFRNANNDKFLIEKIQNKNEKSIISYQVNEWSSPEIEIPVESRINKEKREKRRRSRSQDSNKSHKKHKKHKKKEKKKSKRSSYN